MLGNVQASAPARRTLRLISPDAENQNKIGGEGKTDHNILQSLFPGLDKRGAEYLDAMQDHWAPHGRCWKGLGRTLRRRAGRFAAGLGALEFEILIPKPYKP